MTRTILHVGLRAWIVLATTFFALASDAERAHAGVGTTVPISAELGTHIASQLFPLTLHLEQGTLFLTRPAIVLIDNQRIALQARFQAYDHRPAENIALSELGQAQISGALDFDPVTREILLLAAKIDSLKFDRDSAATQQFDRQIQAAWTDQVSDPIRSEIPPHPYLTPFKAYIDDISYDGRNIILTIVYK